MARFILDIATHYKEKSLKAKTKKLLTVNDIETKYLGNYFKEFMEEVGNVAEKMGSCASITCIEPHNISQFHERTYLNKLTKKQIRTFNKEPHG